VPQGGTRYQEPALPFRYYVMMETVMMELLLLSLIVGAAISTRFNVVVLGSTVVVGVALIAGASAAVGDGVWSNALPAVVMVAGTQIGYFVGIAARAVIPGTRAGSVRAAGDRLATGSGFR
jgi:hypothetical protein